ncbi:hypothetical protein ICE98_01753 [Lactococcus lactis]|nr:hypothetical protein [Lactococcus lactis]
MTNKEEIQTLINNYATYADTRQTKSSVRPFHKRRLNERLLSME